MENLLDFLNNAAKEQLSGVSGISESLAEKFIQARPFGQVEDSLEVKGFGKNLLARLEKTFTDQVKTEPIEIEEEVKTELSVPEYKEPGDLITDEIPREKKSRGFWRAVGRFFRFLFWVVVIAGIILGAGALVYYGLPYIQENFIQPLNVNTAQISQIATQQAEALDELKTELGDLDTRLGDAEADIGSIQSEIVAMDERIVEMEENLAALDQQVSDNQDALTIQMRDNLTISYVLELVGRARLHLNQGNYGLAQENIRTALDRLETLSDSLAENRQIEIDKVVNRLELALSILPEYPVVAANDLEIAWYLLIEAAP